MTSVARNRQGMQLSAVATSAFATALARTSLGAGAPWREVVVDGVRLACDDEGSGPALVCLHAIGHGAGDFAALRARLRDRFRVVALDWPGHGQSAADPQPPSAARYAALLAGTLDGLGIERAVLLGNSIGGAAALRCAAAAPDRVRALIIENAGGLEPVGRLARVATGGMARFFAAGARGAWWFPRAYAAYYRSVLPCPAAAEQRARIVAAGPEMAPLLRDAWRSFGRADADLRALIPRITCPVLFAWAKRDRIIQLRRSAAAIRSFPNGRLRTFAAGHAAHLETPDEFTQCIEEFLAELG